MMSRVHTASPQARVSRHGRFRIAVIVLSALAAVVGSVVLATRDTSDVTTHGVTATLRVPGHPGAVAAGPDALWVALIDEPRRPVGDQPLLRVDPASGIVAQTVHVGGEVSSLVRVGNR